MCNDLRWEEVKRGAKPRGGWRDDRYVKEPGIGRRKREKKRGIKRKRNNHKRESM